MTGSTASFVDGSPQMTEIIAKYIKYGCHTFQYSGWNPSGDTADMIPTCLATGEVQLAAFTTTDGTCGAADTSKDFTFRVGPQDFYSPGNFYSDDGSSNKAIPGMFPETMLQPHTYSRPVCKERKTCATFFARWPGVTYDKNVPCAGNPTGGECVGGKTFFFINIFKILTIFFLSLYGSHCIQGKDH